MSLAALSTNVQALVILTVIAVGWSVFGLLYLAPRIHGPHWLEPGLADLGHSQRNVAIGFILAGMVDPKHQTNAATAYCYKQLTYEPLLGCGIITALNLPIVLTWGALPFATVSAVRTVALAFGV